MFELEDTDSLIDDFVASAAEIFHRSTQKSTLPASQLGIRTVNENQTAILKAVYELSKDIDIPLDEVSDQLLAYSQFYMGLSYILAAASISAEELADTED